MERAETNGQSYRPLIVIISLVALSAFALELSQSSIAMASFMRHFMGLFFVLFSMFKLFDLEVFVSGFRMYDLLAKRARFYAQLYPFIELSLGLLYLSGHVLMLTNVVTLMAMSISATGVIYSLASGMNVRCACLGTVLNVPLSTVSVIENVGMGAMAAMMLL